VLGICGEEGKLQLTVQIIHPVILSAAKDLALDFQAFGFLRPRPVAVFNK
jgi:hypothetical protein